MSLLDDVWKKMQEQAGITTTTSGTTFYPYGSTPHEGERLEAAHAGAYGRGLSSYGSAPTTVPSDGQPPTNGGGTPGAGTGNDPLSTLAAAYMASLGGGGGAQQQPVVILPAPATDGAGVNWGMIGALAALALVGWAVWTWWKGRHKHA